MTFEPIQAETLGLLEWPRLCEQLAGFAVTGLGRRAALGLQPQNRQSAAQLLLHETTEIGRLDQRQPGGLGFAGVADIGPALDRAERGGVLSGEELLQVASTLAAVRQLRRLIEDAEDLPTLEERVADLRTYPELEQQIHFCIEDSGLVADRASEVLGSIRLRLKQLRSQILDKLQTLIRMHGNALQETVPTQREGRFCLAVKAGQKEQIGGIVHDSSASGSTLYIEPRSTTEWQNQLRQLQKQEEVEAEKVRRRLSEAIAAVHGDLERLLAIATALDLALARSRYGLWLEANCPRFIDRDRNEAITLRQLRHPLLVWQQQRQQGPDVVPVDLLIGPQLRVVAITGPNTGGKTVTLKTLGLAMLMARAGLFVPAREPVELPWFDDVLADIGDEQSLQQSLSTFSGHIRRIGRILGALQPSRQALVLLDEVGAGTDPSEGSALAIALLQHLADHAALTMATTHFGELKALKYQDARFENASVEFDDVSLSPTYRLLWGIPGRSNALAIARRLGLEESVVTRAELQLAPGGSADVNAVIRGLEEQRREQESKAKEAAQLLAKAEKFYAEVAARAENLKAREQELRQTQEQAIQAEIEQARSRVAKVVRRIQQGPGVQKAERARQAGEELKQLAQKHRPAPQVKPGFRPRVGDKVRLRQLGKAAEVLALSEDGRELQVRCGILKLSVGLEEIESLQGEKAELPEIPQRQPEKRPKGLGQGPAVRTEKNTLDVRGSRVADAEVVIEEALRHASGPVWIIHGHGTGKLRQGIHEFLRHHPIVGRFGDAEREDGGSGVTVVHLK